MQSKDIGTSKHSPGARRRIFLAAVLLLAVAAAAVFPGEAMANGEMAAPRLSSGSPGELTVAWDTPSPTPTDYRLTWAPAAGDWLSYRDPNESERGNLYPGGSDTSLTLSGLTPGSTYKVKMRARYGPGNSGPWSAESTLRVRANPPAAPTGLSLDAEHDSITLSWTAPQDADIAGYRIWRGPDADNLSVLVNDTGSTATSYTDGAVAAETSYRYAVAAINTDGDAGAQAGGSAVTPAAPDKEKDRPPRSGVVPLNTAPVFASTTVSRSIPENTTRSSDIGAPVAATDADGDELAYGLGGPDAPEFAIVSATGQIRTHTHFFVSFDHEAKSSYSVTVNATDNNGGYATANVTITITDVDEPPSAPAAPTVDSVVGSATSVLVSWSAPANSGKPPITSYDLRYRQGTSGGWTDGPEDQTGTSATISSLTASAMYQVQVRASNDEGNSPWSEAGSGMAGKPSATLISNTGQTATEASRLHFDYATAFTTGASSGGYKLTGVDLRLAETDDGVPSFTIAIHAAGDNPDSTGTSLGTLSKTTALVDDALNSWTTTSEIDLAPNTTYFIVVNGAGTGSDNDGLLRGTDEDGEDSGGASGWSIANTGLSKTQSATNWTQDSSMMMAVKGYVKNVPPVFDPSMVARSVAENTAENQNVGQPVTATDANTGDTLTYSLGGTDAASFTIVASSGQIRTRSGVTYDHETKSSYSVTVTASDGNRGNATADVTITITDVDEPPSKPAAPTVAAFPGSSTHLQVSWTAPANTGPSLVYDLRFRESGDTSWMGGPQGVSGTTAFIRYLTANTSYEVQVRARNDEGDSLWSPAGSGATNDDPAVSSSRLCPDGGVGWEDFRHSRAISELVVVGQPATGTLNAGHCGDFLRLVGLERGKTYRATVDFKGQNSVGGSIKVFNRGPTEFYFGYTYDWDSNFDGNAIVDFELDERGRDPSDVYLRINPDTGLGAKATHVGDYSVTLTDITGIQYLVGNIRGLTNTVTRRWVGKDHTIENRIGFEFAQSFTTASHTDGYILDRVVAYIETNSVSNAQPRIAIHSNASGKPGTKLCDLVLPLDYDPGLSFSGVPTGRVMVDKMYAGGCANQTLGASTTYWVVFADAESQPFSRYSVVESSYDTEDSLGAAGWTMGNDIARRGVGHLQTGNWFLRSGTKPIALGIVGREK